MRVRRYVFLRILQFIPVVLAVIIINFVLIHIAPGDVAITLAGEDADPGLMFDTLSGRLFQLPGSTLLFPAHPLGGRRVALVGEQRLRTASLLAGSRDAFITEMLSRRTTAQRRARPSSATRRH